MRQARSRAFLRETRLLPFFDGARMCTKARGRQILRSEIRGLSPALESLDRVSFLAHKRLSSHLTVEGICASRNSDRCVHRLTEMMVRIQNLPPTFLSPLLLFFFFDVHFEVDFHFGRSIDPPVVHALQFIANASPPPGLDRSRSEHAGRPSMLALLWSNFISL